MFSRTCSGDLAPTIGNAWPQGAYVAQLIATCVTVLEYFPAISSSRSQTFRHFSNRPGLNNRFCLPIVGRQRGAAVVLAGQKPLCQR